jgi:hypothetical protein
MVDVWREVGQYATSRDWQLTGTVQSRYLRIRTLSTPNFFSKAYLCKSRILGGVTEQAGNDNRWIGFFPQIEARVIDLGQVPPLFETTQLSFRRSLASRIKINWRFAVDELMDYDPMRSKRIFDVTQASLDVGVFTAPHNLQDEYVDYMVWDNNKSNVQPGEALIVDQNNMLFDFSNLTPLIGTYKLVIFK